MPKFLRGFTYAFEGLAHALRTQVNFRVHGAITLAVVVAALVLGVSALEAAVLALTIGIVLAAELFNTAIEALVDLTSPQVHPLAKTAKDCAAAAVLISAMAAVVVGLAIFLPKLQRLL
jgi:diacylglycerol kinase